MENKFTDITIDLLLSGIAKKIKEVKEELKWKELFLKTGKFYIENPDKSDSFKNDLFAVFSEENMKNMAYKLRNKRGYELPQLLYNSLYELMAQYEIPQMDTETYIHYFIQVIIDDLENSDFNKALELYIGNWKIEEEKHFYDVEKKVDLLLRKIKDLEKFEVSSFTINDIDVQIRKESKFKRMGLDFFELDDEQFEEALQKSICNERIYIVGKSREETTYRILNELRKKNSDKPTLVIKSDAEWKRLEQADIRGTILIPFFYAERIVAIANNTNIFIYGEDEPCYSQEKLILRNRTRRNLNYSLEKIGMNGTEAQNIVENTHGLYIPLKKKLFNGAMYGKPEWIRKHSDIVMAALLCGKWMETDGDKIVFEELSGIEYNKCKKELENYSRGENPFVVTNRGYGRTSMQLASVEDAWEELDSYISDRMWDNFINLFYEVLIESEPIFNYPFEKHFEASIYAEEPEWSPILKQGMIRSLIMRAYYRNHTEYQYQIDCVVGKIFSTITNKERWGYISQYITDLCEASPDAVLSKLESELQSPTGLAELFAASDGDFLTGRHYYIRVLWAVEQLLLQKKYVARAVEWLWKMNAYDIKYSISNSPKSVLQIVFCAWKNASVLTVDAKINMARKAIRTYQGAWEIIVSELPQYRSSISHKLNAPKYRRSDEPFELYEYEMDKTYIEYLKMCVDVIGTDTDRWIRMIDYLQWYDEEVQDEAVKELIFSCNQMKDCEKIKIKNKIRQLLYQHRHYTDADWSMSEFYLKKYEKLLETITLREPVYEYLYLFSPIYEFSLLNPIAFNRERDSKDKRTDNALLRESEIKSKLKIFQEKNYCLETLMDLAIENEKSILGIVLAQFYCEEAYDEEVFKLLLIKDKEGKQAYDYARTLIYKQAVDLQEIVTMAKKFADNKNLIVSLISLQIIDDNKDAIICGENDSVKEEYWSRNLRIRISDNANEAVCIWALNECYKYGTLDSYVELLFALKERLYPIQIYEYIFKIENMKSSFPDSMTEYYLGELLAIIQNYFGEDMEMCRNIAALEWLCRNILDWHQMKCMQFMLKTDPTVYAGFVGMIYKADEDDGAEEEKAVLADKVYEGFKKAKFCPAEKDGKVVYEEIREWMDRFKILLIKQRQESLFAFLAGRLLANSPIGEDGHMPCEAVRKIVEEEYSESLKTEYIIAEKNKRGSYVVDAGKSELRLYEKYRRNAEALQYQYPRTAEVYFELSDIYKYLAERERRSAEEVWY